MKIPGLRRRSRAAVSTVIGTIIFIVAALSIFTALAATNIAGMNYQNAAQQASNKNGLKAEEQIRASPVYDTGAYAEYTTSSNNTKTTFTMMSSASVQWAEAGIAVSSQLGAVIMQHQSASCPEAGVCSLTLNFPPTAGDTMAVAVALDSGASAFGASPVSDDIGTNYGASQVVSHSSSPALSVGIWAGVVPASQVDARTVTVSLVSGSAPGIFSVFVYDVAAGADVYQSGYAVQTASGTGSSNMMETNQITTTGYYFLLGVVVTPNDWQALSGPGFTLEKSPVDPTEFSLTNDGATTTTFKTVMYVYHQYADGGYNGNLSQYAEDFNEAGGFCSASLPNGMMCVYQLSNQSPPGLDGRHLSFVDAPQKLSVGVTTYLGNTFWYNYTAYALENAGGTVSSYPFTPNWADLINIEVARGLGPAKLSYPAFSFYYSQGTAAGIGDGYKVNGYFGFSVPQGTYAVWQVNISNYDPGKRSITIGAASQLVLSPLSGGSGNGYFIVGSLHDDPYDQILTNGVYSPVTIPYKQWAILNFSATKMCDSPSSCNLVSKTPSSSSAGMTPFMAQVLLVGTYNDEIPFAQNLPVSATFISGVAVTGSAGAWCKVGEGTNKPTCQFLYPQVKGIPTLSPGGTYTFQFTKGFTAITSAFFMTPSAMGGIVRPVQDITGNLRTDVATSFTVPPGATQGFYEVEVTDGMFSVLVTVWVS